MTPLQNFFDCDRLVETARTPQFLDASQPQKSGRNHKQAFVIFHAFLWLRLA
jgi:hypothetical protein